MIETGITGTHKGFENNITNNISNVSIIPKPDLCAEGKSTVWQHKTDFFNLIHSILYNNFTLIINSFVCYYPSLFTLIVTSSTNNI